MGSAPVEKYLAGKSSQATPTATDEKQIRAWWREDPHANIGLRALQNEIILDIDPRVAGDKSLDMLQTLYGLLPDTPQVFTGGGGRHHYFSIPASDKFDYPGGGSLESVGYPGVEWKAGGGGYVVAPPSNHYTGGVYSWEVLSALGDIPYAEAPAWLLRLVQQASGPQKRQASPVSEGQRPTGQSTSWAWADVQGFFNAMYSEGSRRTATGIPRLTGILAARGHVPVDMAVDFLLAWQVTHFAPPLTPEILTSQVEAMYARWQPQTDVVQGKAFLDRLTSPANLDVSKSRIPHIRLLDTSLEQAPSQELEQDEPSIARLAAELSPKYKEEAKRLLPQDPGAYVKASNPIVRRRDDPLRFVSHICFSETWQEDGNAVLRRRLYWRFYYTIFNLIYKIFNKISSIAILVKDRYQAEATLRLLTSRAIPAVTRSHTPLGKTLAFQSIRELFEALAAPRDLSCQRIVEQGPFKSICLNASRTLLKEQGLILFCRQLMSYAAGPELKQVIEELLLWKESFSFHGIQRFLALLEKKNRQLETREGAVQILTIHVSKGLEFDVVFALGLMASSPEAEEEAEELDAEKLRQLYVAMTRAKHRLYVPYLDKPSARRSPSPMELFSKILEREEGSFFSFINRISQTESITFENIPQKVVLPCSTIEPKENIPPSLLPLPEIIPSFLQSFTSLARVKHFELKKQKEDLFTPHTIPRGTATGTIIHHIFETIFSSSFPIWRDPKLVETVIHHSLRSSPLIPWETVIQEMVWNTLTLPLPVGFSLIDLQSGQIQVEMEFLFSKPPHFVKGFIDLVFMHEGKLFFLDWKTNWLGENDAAYESLDEAMTVHDYWLQAALYKEALRRHVKQFYITPFEEIFGGAIYCFLRGKGICHFDPVSYDV